MAIIGVTAKKNVLAGKVFNEIIERGTEQNIVKNPFVINATLKSLKENFFFVLDIVPVYPPVHWFGYLLLFPFIYFGWFNFFLIFPLVLIGLGFFWSETFYKLMLIAGLRKKGYKDKIKFLSKKDIIRRLM